MQDRTERLILIVGLFVGVLVFGYVISLFAAARQADAQADASAARLAQSLIGDYQTGFSEFMSRLVVSDAAFDAAQSQDQSPYFSKVCRGDRFRSQIANFGLIRRGEIEFLCAYGDVKKPEEHRYLNGEMAAVSRSLIARVSADQKRYQLVLSEYVHEVDYVTVDDRAYLVVAALVRPTVNRKSDPAFVPVVAFAMVSLDRTIAARYPEKLSLKNFHVIRDRDASPSRYSTPIRSKAGSPVAFLAWDGSHQFQDLLIRLLPSIVIITLISGLFVVRYLREIGKLQRIISAQEAEARHLSLHDGLTGLPNRTRFGIVLREAIAQASIESPCFIGFLDLDHFKQVNDTYGHDVGDALIKEAANRVQGLMGEQDLLARLGGDEFAFVVRSHSTEASIRLLCKDLVEAVKQPLLVDGETIKPSASLGVATCSRNDTDADGLLKDADIALYAAKNRGRGCFSVYGEDETPVATAAE